MGEASWPLFVAANEFGEHPALVSSRGTMSFREYGELARGVSGALRVAGIGSGDRIAIAGLPSEPYIALLMGGFHLGAVACPINTRLPRRMIADLVLRMQSMAFFVDDYFSVIRLEHIPTLRIEHMIAEAAQEIAPPPPDALDRIGTVVFTSGSMGFPKAALVSYANHCYNARASNENIALGPGDRWLLSLPMYHVSGLSILFRCMLGGAAVVVPDTGDTLESAIQRFEVTHVSLVATQLFRLMQSQSGVAALKRTKAILLGGSMMPAALIRQAYELGLPIFASYGLTEMASQVTATRPGDSLDALLSSGRPLLPDSLHISPKLEILVRGKTLFRGYAHGVRFDLPLAADGWFVTGDLGQLDKDGNLHVIGRRDNMFISGGENIQPEEIERQLCAVEGVLQSLVVPVSCAEFGARPVAFVRTDTKHTLDPESLSSHLKSMLPSYKVPIQFLPWPEEGSDATAKVSRSSFAELAELLRQPHRRSFT